MLLAVPGAVAHVYHIQRALVKVGETGHVSCRYFTDKLGTEWPYPCRQGLGPLTWARLSAKIPPTWGSVKLPESEREVCGLTPIGPAQAFWAITPMHKISSPVWYWTAIQGGVLINSYLEVYALVLHNATLLE